MSGMKRLKDNGDSGEQRKSNSTTRKPLLEGLDILTSPINKLGWPDEVLSVRLKRCFKMEGVETVFDLAQKTEKDILGMRSISPFRRRILFETKKVLAGYGLSLDMDKNELDDPSISDVLQKPVGVAPDWERVMISLRIPTGFRTEGIQFVYELVQKTEDEIAGMGVFTHWPKKVSNVTREVLEKHGLSLGMVFHSSALSTLERMKKNRRIRVLDEEAIISLHTMGMSYLDLRELALVSQREIASLSAESRGALRATLELIDSIIGSESPR